MVLIQNCQGLLVTNLIVSNIFAFLRRGPVRFKFQSLFELENVAVVNMTSADGMYIVRQSP